MIATLSASSPSTYRRFLLRLGSKSSTIAASSSRFSRNGGVKSLADGWVSAMVPLGMFSPLYEASEGGPVYCGSHLNGFSAGMLMAEISCRNADGDGTFVVELNPVGESIVERSFEVFSRSSDERFSRRWIWVLSETGRLIRRRRVKLAMSFLATTPDSTNFAFTEARLLRASLV